MTKQRELPTEVPPDPVDTPEPEVVKVEDEAPVTIGRFLDNNYPDMDKGQRGVFISKHGTKILTPTEWISLVEPELTSRIL